eukprot:Gb_16989 [translate_table: standard]
MSSSGMRSLLASQRNVQSNRGQSPRLRGINEGLAEGHELDEGGGPGDFDGLNSHDARPSTPAAEPVVYHRNLAPGSMMVVIAASPTGMDRAQRQINEEKHANNDKIKKLSVQKCVLSSPCNPPRVGSITSKESNQRPHTPQCVECCAVMCEAVCINI